MRDRRFPIVTTIVFVVTGVAELLQWAIPAWGAALERDPGGLSWGHWWRLFSPLLTQMASPGVSGTAQFVSNMLFLAVIGVGAERVLGPRWWLAGYVVGGVVGQATGYWLEPPGGGTSVAVLGVAALLAAAVVLGEQAPSVSLMFVGYFLLAITLTSLTNWIAAMAVIVVGAWCYQFARPRWPRRADLAVVGIAVLAAAVLIAAGDHHGWAFTAGLALTPLYRRSRQHRTTSPNEGATAPAT
ncbi:rhomboid family intramembrane serine protease [Dactylosporangium sp. NPDC051541]|uniref:rhomboid family intramembrane serine protease n=1 Tax=Dactylosporangium sp. NPDC051541 TaxID=3363977 RepID=UPI0037A30798